MIFVYSFKYLFLFFAERETIDGGRAIADMISEDESIDSGRVSSELSGTLASKKDQVNKRIFTQSVVYDHHKLSETENIFVCHSNDYDLVLFLCRLNIMVGWFHETWLSLVCKRKRYRINYLKFRIQFGNSSCD